MYQPWYEETDLVPAGKNPVDASVAAHVASELKLPSTGQVDSRHTIEDLLNYVEALRLTRGKEKTVPQLNLDDPGAQSSGEDENESRPPTSSSAAASLSKLSAQ